MNEEDEEEGRLGSIHEECRISASQESYLQNCPFARESDVFLDDSDEEDLTPWTSTHTQLDRIVMVSPPESPKDNEVFQTPPEGSIIDSSQEKDAATAAAAPVDSIPGRRTEGGDGYVVEEDDVYAEAAVNLVRDSDNLGFTSVKLNQVSDKPLENETSVIKENVNNQEEEEEVLYFDSPETVRKTSGSLLGEDDRLKRNGGEGTSSDKMVTDDFDRFKYVSSSVVSRKRKEVCPEGDVRRQDRDALVNGPMNRNEILKALMEALQMVTGKTNDDGASSSSEEVDFLETAKRRGMVFPRPRWWRPSEGIDD